MIKLRGFINRKLTNMNEVFTSVEAQGVILLLSKNYEHELSYEIIWPLHFMKNIHCLMKKFASSTTNWNGVLKFYFEEQSI
jgi:hypothetical protein